MSGFKLSNIVLRVDGHAADHPEIYYRVILVRLFILRVHLLCELKGTWTFSHM